MFLFFIEYNRYYWTAESNEWLFFRYPNETCYIFLTYSIESRRISHLSWIGETYNFIINLNKGF